MFRFRFLVLPMILAGCSAAPSHSNVNHPYEIDSENQAPFPAQPVVASVTYRHSGTSVRTNSAESSVEKFSNIQHVKRTGDSKLMISWKPERFKKELDRAGKRFIFTDDKILPAANLAVKVDCSTKKVIEKSGFQEALDRVEKAKPRGEEKDFLIASLSGFVEHAPDLCQGNEGPFDVRKVMGKKPGYRWVEEVPIVGLRESKLNAEFLGWHNKENRSYAVLYGHLDADGLLQESGTNIDIHATIGNYLLVSADWGRVIRDVTTTQSVSAPGKLPFSGKIKMDLLTERLPEDQL